MGLEGRAARGRPGRLNARWADDACADPQGSGDGRGRRPGDGGPARATPRRRAARYLGRARTGPLRPGALGHRPRRRRGDVAARLRDPVPDVPRPIRRARRRPRPPVRDRAGAELGGRPTSGRGGARRSRRRGCTFLAVGTHPESIRAQRFYERLGFERAPREDPASGRRSADEGAAPILSGPSSSSPSAGPQGAPQTTVTLDVPLGGAGRAAFLGVRRGRARIAQAFIGGPVRVSRCRAGAGAAHAGAEVGWPQSPRLSSFRRMSQNERPHSPAFQFTAVHLFVPAKMKRAQPYGWARIADLRSEAGCELGGSPSCSMACRAGAAAGARPAAPCRAAPLPRARRSAPTNAAPAGWPLHRPLSVPLPRHRA